MKKSCPFWNSSSNILEAGLSYYFLTSSTFFFSSASSFSFRSLSMRPRSSSIRLCYSSRRSLILSSLSFSSLIYSLSAITLSFSACLSSSNRALSFLNFRHSSSTACRYLRTSPYLTTKDSLMTRTSSSYFTIYSCLAASRFIYYRIDSWCAISRS